MTFTATNMKRFVTILAVAATVSCAAHAGEKTLGIHAGYNSRGESALAGITFTYRFSEHFRLAPSVSYVFKHHDLDAYAFNIDTQYPIVLGTSRVSFYPLAGLSLSSWTMRYADAVDTDDAKSRYSRIGFNVGGGFDMRVTSTLRVGIEAAYNYVKDFDGANIRASIAYCF